MVAWPAVTHSLLDTSALVFSAVAWRDSESMHPHAILISDTFLGLLALFQGVATLAIDLGRAHATNPDWPGHARFHVVWGTLNVALLTMVAEGVLFSDRLSEFMRFHLALAITVMPMFGFLGALAFRGLYGATLGDKNGMLPWIVNLWGSQRKIDLNSVAVIAGLLTSVALLLLHDCSW